ncbi:hypothetical protein DPMN_131882 [Dreissena polymorpha]|uniref:Uncharacterized protein n=1 Tax=Dreissena polymorpha TaxID=45954 RepID=A0A9D4JD84_DREPO|nr:hypothetical protein DPMN_131882 [Dreissena polymorpha]
MEQENITKEKKNRSLDQDRYHLHKIYNHHQPTLTLKRKGRRPLSLQGSMSSTCPIEHQML